MISQNDAPRVLVADDDATVRLIATAALEKHGFAVRVVEDGAVAWREMQENEFDLVLLDVEMPGYDGFSLCRKIRDDLKSDVPVLLVTGHDDVTSIECAYVAGATDFIAKPINWPLLGHRLRYVLRSYRNLQSLDLAKARHRAMLRALPDVLLRVDVTGALIEQHGQQAADNKNIPAQLSNYLSEEASAKCLRGIVAAVNTGNVQDIEYTIESPGQRRRVFEGRISPINESEALCLLRDVTERREADQRILSLAYFDPLTGLPNRASFQELLKISVYRAERESSRLAVLFLDIDGFKAVNDSFGHTVGDHVLQRVAERLRNTLRLSDSVGRNVSEGADKTPSISRLGGDEFTILLPSISSPDDAMVVAQRVCDAFDNPFNVDGQDFVLSTSIGISLFPDDASSPALLVKHADTAMYAAKDQGRAQAHFYSASLTEKAMYRLRTESALRLAFTRNELQVHYQAVVDTTSKRVISFEALVRWLHPEQGLLPPSEFIQLAEECGLIAKLGAIVLRIACMDAVKWNTGRTQPISVAVNLSPIQLSEPTLAADIAEVLKQTGLAPRLLELEITESALVDRTDVSLNNLKALSDLGVCIALDDFGTGYSSLAYLRELPLSSIKIDRSFIENLPNSKADAAIVRTIITLSENLGLRVVGEGVESLVQLETLAEMGCSTLQGFHFSHPLDYKALTRFLHIPLRLSERV
jgi:diguanylate cyclase (GGDEF)-like protein